MTEPILVYDRIDENRRKTRWLVAGFALILLPFLLALVPVLFTTGSFLLTALPSATLDRLLASGGSTLALLVLAVTLAAAGGLAFVEYEVHHAESWILRRSHARPIDAEREEELLRVVENLSIGAGLPMPDVRIAEVASPNAFAVGLEPDRSSIVVTRGLLELLERRELQAVVAHELSHIGNGDARLSTVLAGFLAFLRAPRRILAGLSPRLYTGCLILSTVGFCLFLLSLLGWTLEAVMIGALLFNPRWRQESRLDELFAQTGWSEFALFFSLAVYGMLFLGGPFYLLLGGRALGALAGRAVSRERERQADADAVLLTRDPEALALALVKIDAVGHLGGLPDPPATAHLYIVDPIRDRVAFGDRTFDTHPSIDERIDVLARMGGGIPPGRIGRAREEVARRWSSIEADVARAEAASRRPRYPSVERLTSEETALYGAPEDGATIVARLAHGTDVTVLGPAGSFVEVRTAGGVTGYLRSWEPRIPVRELDDWRKP